VPWSLDVCAARLGVRRLDAAFTQSDRGPRRRLVEVEGKIDRVGENGALYRESGTRDAPKFAPDLWRNRQLRLAAGEPGTAGAVP